MINEFINTCYATTSTLRSVASYAHLVPVILSFLLILLVFIKSKRNLFSKIFFAFIFFFSLWLIGDYIIWTSNNYYLIYTIWSFLDYVEIIFYVFGFYFSLIFVRKSDVVFVGKFLLFFITLIPLFITITLQSVIGFNYPVCEAFNNDFLGTYKLILEGVILVILLIYAITPLFKKSSWKERGTSLVVLGSMFLFLSTFGITEYLASVTGYYEMNLYSLFLLPLFLIAIIYAVFELDIFNFHVLSTYYLVIGFIVLMGGQLFFITDTTSKLLTILAIIMAGVLSIILFRNLKRESDQRIQIGKLNINLEKVIKQRESLVHLVTHKVKGAFTRSKYIFAGLLDGTFGDTSPTIKKYAKQGLDSDNGGIQTVDLVLEASNLTSGSVKFDMKMVDFREIIEEVLSEKKIQVAEKSLQMESKMDNGVYSVMGDRIWLKEAINNLIDNSIKYTPAGKISVKLEDGDGKVKFSIKDTGLGITNEDKNNLFTEGGRGKDSVRVNVDSTGYGLYSVKLIIEAHKGRVWAESEGAGKGSAFYIELSAVK